MLHCLQLLLLAIIAIIGKLECGSSFTPVAGKCRTFNITPTPMDMTGLAGLRFWEVIYTTDAPPYPNVDHEYRYVTPIADGVFRVDDVRTLRDGTTEQYTFIGSIIDGIVSEEAVEADGVRHEFRLITLALSVDQAILYYRCSDVGDPDLDTMFIEIPKDKKLSKAGLKYILEEAKKYNFRNKLRPLPKALHKLEE